MGKVKESLRTSIQFGDGEPMEVDTRKLAEAADRLNSNPEVISYIERVERLTVERSEVSEQIASVYQEAKDKGFNTDALKYIVKMRAMETEKRRMLANDVGLYARGGVLPFDETPLGAAAGDYGA